MSLDEFEFGQNSAADSGASDNGENLVSNLEPLFLVGSFSFLQVTRTTIKAWMSTSFGRIPPLTSELAALERLKKSNNKLVSTLAP